jgi:hypothetical protein
MIMVGATDGAEMRVAEEEGAPRPAHDVLAIMAVGGAGFAVATGRRYFLTRKQE